MTQVHHHPAVTVGKYLISPLVRPVAGEWFDCSVSIQSGSGRGTSDRIVRLTPLFRDRLAAARYALQQGLEWIGAPAAVAPAEHSRRGAC